MSGTTLNALSFDVEGFVEANLQSFPIPAAYVGRREEAYEVEANTHAILELLADLQVKATFFFLASVIVRLPDVVRTTAREGHEVGVHGPDHVRVFDLSPETFRERLVATKAHLEEVTSAPVHGFRAPDFSITKASLWALDILQDEGFRYDSSVYPFGFHDVYGIEGVHPYIQRWPNGLLEFPLSTVALLGRRVPYGGGGYFRFFPLRLTKAFLERSNAAGHPANVYMHPYEVGPIVPNVPTPTWLRRLRHYHNCRNGGARLRRLVSAYRFGPLIEVLDRAGWLETI